MHDWADGAIGHREVGPIPRLSRSKILDDFDFLHQRSVSRQQISHLHQLDFPPESKNVIFLGPLGTGKRHLSIALGAQAARKDFLAAFATASEMGDETLEAKRDADSPTSWKRLEGFSRSSLADTNEAPSSSPPTKASPPGQKSLETESPSQPWSTGSSTAAKSDILVVCL